MIVTIKQTLIAFGLMLAVTFPAFSQSNNPILPGFHADPEILYSNKTKKYVPAWSQVSSRIPVKTKNFEKQKLEGEKAKNTQNPSSNKAFIDDEDEQLIQKAQQRLKEQGSIRVRIEDW